MKTLRKIRVAGYIRVSDQSQVERFSLDAQREGITRWCEHRDYVLVQIYAEEGVSAHFERIEKRPRLMSLLADAGKGDFDLVLVHMIDRWARRNAVQAQSLQKLGDAKVGFASVTEEIDMTTPAGRLMLTMMGGINEFFSDQLGVHVSKAQRQRALQGLPVGSVPFGYRVVEPGGVPALVEAERDVVRGLFIRRSAGESKAMLAAWLNSSGFKTREGHMFTGHAVKDILNSKFYTGVVVYKGEEFPGKHPAIIDRELFDRVQASRRTRPSPRTVRGPTGLLQGIIFCGGCGRPIQSDRHRFGAPQYRERHAWDCPTNGKSLVSHHLDDQIATVIAAVELQSDWRDRIVKLVTARHPSVDIPALRHRRRLLGIALADETITEEDYRGRLNEIDGQLRSAGQVLLPTVAEAAALLENIPKLWREATPEERRKLIRPLIERVYVDLEGKMVGAITPAPGFRTLLEGAMSRAKSSAVLLISPEESERLKVWSWWRRGRVELPVQKNSAAERLRA